MNPSQEILEQSPPHDADAERWVLGSIILKPSVLDDLGFLRPADFYCDGDAELFGALVEARNSGQPIDAGLLLKRFKGDGWAAKIGEIVSGVPHVGHVAHYARIVADRARWRLLRDIGEDAIQTAFRAEGSPDEAVDALEAKLAGVTLATGDTEPITLADAAVQAIGRIDEIQRRGKSAGVPTGLSSFDADQGGLFPGELAILAARPGCGKTSLALQVADYNARRGRLVYFASLEMSSVELSIRLACGESGVSNRLVRIGQISPEASAALSEAFNGQATSQLEVHDRAAMTVAAIRREIRKRKKRGLALAVIDYLQLVQPDDRRMPREQQVARIVRSLKETAREYNTPILCLCQLNRQADNDSPPMLSHLRESGAIEQDADVVLFLQRHEPKDDEVHNAILTVAKNRNGETGPLRLDWDASRTRFSVPGYAEFAEFATP